MLLIEESDAGAGVRVGDGAALRGEGEKNHDDQQTGVSRHQGSHVETGRRVLQASPLRQSATIDPMRRTWRDWVVLTLGLAVLLAPVGGAAMVPDATWIPGLYDGADGDEVLALVWDNTPAVASSLVALHAPVGTLLELPRLCPPPIATVPPSAACRAPPHP